MPECWHGSSPPGSGLKDGSGDPLLDEVLAEIELRVEVELAKMKPDTTP